MHRTGFESALWQLVKEVRLEPSGGAGAGRALVCSAGWRWR